MQAREHYWTKCGVPVEASGSGEAGAASSWSEGGPACILWLHLCMWGMVGKFGEYGVEEWSWSLV